MCLRIFLNGEGRSKGSYVSLFLVLLKGEYDALLQWPFAQKVRGDVPLQPSVIFNSVLQAPVALLQRAATAHESATTHRMNISALDQQPALLWPSFCHCVRRLGDRCRQNRTFSFSLREGCPTDLCFVSSMLCFRPQSHLFFHQATLRWGTVCGKAGFFPYRGKKSTCCCKHICLLNLCESLFFFWKGGENKQRSGIFLRIRWSSISFQH